MGVEAGPSGAVGAGVAAPVSGPSIINEGPAFGAASFALEGFRPMNITDITPIDKGGTREPLGEIVFNAKPLTTESAIAQAETIISEARTSSNPAMPQPEPLSGEIIPFRHSYSDTVSVDQAVQPEPEVRKIAKLVVSPSTAIQAEAVYAPAPIESGPIVQDQLVEEIVEQQAVKLSDRVDESPDTLEQEEVEESSIRYVEHEEVSKRRIQQLRQAVGKADAEGQDEEIAGDTLKKYFAPEDGSNRAGIAPSGAPDQSLEETYQVLAGKDYGSAREAYQAVEATVEEIKPVKKAKEGKKVKEIDIARILRDPFLKRHPTEEVVARVAKKTIVEIKPGKKIEVTSAVQTEELLEPTIQDLGLAEIFPKA